MTTRSFSVGQASETSLARRSVESPEPSKNAGKVSVWMVNLAVRTAFQSFFKIERKAVTKEEAVLLHTNMSAKNSRLV